MKIWTKEEIEFACFNYPKLRTGIIADSLNISKTTLLKLFKNMGVQLVKPHPKPKLKREETIRVWCSRMKKTYGDNIENWKLDNWEPEIFKQKIITDNIYAYRFGRMGFERNLPK